MECEPGAAEWVRVWLSDCVYTAWEVAAVLVGLSSIAFWLVAQLPQFVDNIRNGTADALSPWFLFNWLSGDSLNLLGCILTGDQLATEVYTATYFIFADCCIISQYVYFNMRNRERELDQLEAKLEAAEGGAPGGLLVAPCAAADSLHGIRIESATDGERPPLSLAAPHLHHRHAHSGGGGSSAAAPLAFLPGRS
eukprot:SM003681S13831  [mRNA]  locus=s3681:1:1252:- [translate_table: standard]